MWLSCTNIGISIFVGFRPIAVFRLRHWLSVLRIFVFLRGRGAAQLDFLEMLMLYLMARSSMEETKKILVRRARHGDDLLDFPDFRGMKSSKNSPLVLISYELSAHQMAPGGVIGHWRSHMRTPTHMPESSRTRVHMRSDRQLHPRCGRVTSRTAGYDCANNATVREGRIWLPKQHHLSATPRSRGVGTLRVAGPLTTSLRGLWVSGILSPGNGGTSCRAATPKPTK